MIRRDSGDIDGGGDEEQWRPIGREDGEDWQGRFGIFWERQMDGLRLKTQESSRDFGLGEERAVAGKFT